MRRALISAGLVLALWGGSGLAGPAEDLAACLHDQRPDLALSACTRAIEAGGLAPDGIVGALVGRASARRARGELQAALDDLDEALRREPANGVAHNLRGGVLAALGRWTEAADAFSRAIAFNPADADAHAGRGAMRINLESFREAIADYTAAIRLEPGEARHYRYRARAYRAEREPDRAIADLEEAARLDPAGASDLVDAAGLHHCVGRLGLGVDASGR